MKEVHSNHSQWFLNNMLAWFGGLGVPDLAGSVFNPGKPRPERLTGNNPALQKACERFWQKYPGPDLPVVNGSPQDAGETDRFPNYLSIRKFLKSRHRATNPGSGADNLNQIIQGFLEILIAEQRFVLPGLKENVPTLDLHVLIDEFLSIVTRQREPDPAPEPLPAGEVIRQLPRLPLEFTGRQEEMGSLLQMEQAGPVMITSHGVSGCGKTALALKLATVLKDQYTDGQILIELRSTTPHPQTSVRALKQLLYAFDRTASLPDDLPELIQTYRATLKNRRVLLLIDDAGQASQVEPFLPVPDGCQLLVTARRPFTLPGLQVVDLNVLPRIESVNLLLKLAPHIKGQADALAELCGDLPQAVVMAGEFLGGRLDISPLVYLKRLTITSRRLVNLEAVLKVNLGFLPPSLSLQWRILSVFPFKFDRRAAAQIWDMGVAEAGCTLTDLLSTGLLEYDPPINRYHIPELLRTVAWAELGSEDRVIARSQHAAYYLEVLRKAENLYRKRGSPRCSDGLKLFDWESENIQTGRGWVSSLTASDLQAAVVCAAYPSAAAEIISRRLSPREQIAWHQAAIIAARTLKRKLVEADQLEKLGQAWGRLGDADQALEHTGRALELFRLNGDRNAVCRILGELSLAMIEQGETGQGIAHARQALLLARSAADRQNEVANLACMGLGFASLGQPIEAAGTYQERLEVAIDTGDRVLEAEIRGCLGLLKIVLGKPEEAAREFKQAAGLNLELHDQRNEAANRYNLGLSLYSLGNRKMAIGQMKSAQRTYERLEDPQNDRALDCLQAWARPGDEAARPAG